jgi:phosphohistidine phosphatase
LEDRGLRDAPRMAELLVHKGVKLEALVSSTAMRAMQTARFFAQTQGLADSGIETHRELYHAYPDVILDVAQGMDENLQCVAFFGHNPGYTDLYNLLTKDYIDNVPTCGIFRVDAEVDTWLDFKRGKAWVTAFYYPKQ